MPAAKLIPILLAVALVVLTVVFFFIPASRPAIVDGWFKSARGYKPAKSAEEAMAMFKRAIEKRDFDMVKDYVTGDYLEFFVRGQNDALTLTYAIDNLRSVMKSQGVKSDKVEAALFWLEPFPVFKYDVKNVPSGAAPGRISWADDFARLQAGIQPAVSEKYYEKNPLMWHSLLPVATLIPPDLNVVVREVNGVWKIDLPTGVPGRHLRETVDALNKNATNYRNALRDITDSVKNNPAIKEDFEREFKSNLDRAN